MVPVYALVVRMNSHLHLKICLQNQFLICVHLRSSVDIKSFLLVGLLLTGSSDFGRGRFFVILTLSVIPDAGLFKIKFGKLIYIKER